MPLYTAHENEAILCLKLNWILKWILIDVHVHVCHAYYKMLLHNYYTSICSANQTLFIANHFEVCEAQNATQ